VRGLHHEVVLGAGSRGGHVDLEVVVAHDGEVRLRDDAEEYLPRDLNRRFAFAAARPARNSISSRETLTCTFDSTPTATSSSISAAK